MNNKVYAIRFEDDNREHLITNIYKTKDMAIFKLAEIEHNYNKLHNGANYWKTIASKFYDIVELDIDKDIIY